MLIQRRVSASTEMQCSIHACPGDSGASYLGNDVPLGGLKTRVATLESPEPMTHEALPGMEPCKHALHHRFETLRARGSKIYYPLDCNIYNSIILTAMSAFKSDC